MDLKIMPAPKPKFYSAVGGGELSPAVKWLRRPGGSWVAAHASVELTSWCASHGLDPAPWMERDITEIPDAGSILYRRASGTLDAYNHRAQRRWAA